MKRITLLAGLVLALSSTVPSQADPCEVIDHCRACGGGVFAVPVFIGHAPNGHPVFQWQVVQHRCTPVNSYQRSYRFDEDHYRRDRINSDSLHRDKVNSDAVRLGMPGRHAVTPAAVRAAANGSVRRAK